MSTLNGLLAELGLANPEMHPERDVSQETEWIVNQPFVPTIGQCYEVAYGKVSQHGRERYARARIRIDGAQPSQWFDLDEGQVLAPFFQDCPVRAYRPIHNPSVASPITS